MMNGPWKFVLGLLMLVFSLGSFGAVYVVKTILLQDPTLWVGIGAMCLSLALTFWYLAAGDRFSSASPAASTPEKAKLPIAKNPPSNGVSFWSLLTVLFVGVAGYVVTEKQIQWLLVSLVVCIIIALVAYLFVSHTAEIQHPMKGMDFVICFIVWLTKLYFVVLVALNYTTSVMLAVWFALLVSVFVPAMGLQVISKAIVRFARSAFGTEIQSSSKPMAQAAPMSFRPSKTNQSQSAKNEQPSYTYDDLHGEETEDPVEDGDFEDDKPKAFAPNMRTSYEDYAPNADRFKHVKTEHLFDNDFRFDDDASELDDDDFIFDEEGHGPEDPPEVHVEVGYDNLLSVMKNDWEAMIAITEAGILTFEQYANERIEKIKDILDLAGLRISWDDIFESQQRAAQKAGLPPLKPAKVSAKPQRIRQEFKPAPEPIKIQFDDLKQVRGIGEVTNKTLNNAGISTYQAISEMEPTKFLEILKKANVLMTANKAAKIQEEARKLTKPNQTSEVSLDFSVLGLPPLLAEKLKVVGLNIVTFADSTPEAVNNLLQAKYGKTVDAKVLKQWIDAAMKYVIENG